MTSLSKVYRSHHTVSEEGKKKKIGIRSFEVPQEMDSEATLSLDAVLAERDRLLHHANLSIAQEKAAIDRMRQTAADDIAASRVAWEEEKQVLQQQAYDEGFQAGFMEGRDKALADMAASVQMANETTELSYKNANKYLNSQERVILELAIRSAERIIGQLIDKDDETYLDIVKRALKEAREMKEVKLYVSLDYFELVSDHRTELASIFPPDVPFLIFANDDFDATECIIETNRGRIVVSIDEQLNELREKLVEIMESGD
ncbi:flagellar assembly protein FliH [Sporosarcina sp. 179-K 3D1 HS]|uniref:flagellar assembly protein FliH n=1 Tax=Sporosarcina sp. 179-K 3D1 HS TaxID=3232169 RepID=UPI0039A33D3A